MKIDLVYLWVDGSDAKWRAKRNSSLGGVDTSNQQVFSQGRTADNDELLYSLRSVESYAPWVNHIYIVTDEQVPSWLNLANEKISIVDHSEILPPSALPTFSSRVLELAICNIKGLAEHFIYANDDMMFFRAVEKDYFFDSDGIVNCHYLHLPKDFNCQGKQNIHRYVLVSAAERIAKDFSADYIKDLGFNHQIQAYRKSSIKQCLETYHDWSEFTIHNRFRSADDMGRHILSLYMVVTGVARVIIGSNSAKTRIISLLKILLGLSVGIDSKIISISTSPRSIWLQTKLFKPALVCFNDGEGCTDQHRKSIKKVLEKLYPKKSQFEL